MTLGWILVQALLCHPKWRNQ